MFRGTLFRGEAVPFVMELPNYRMPGAKNVLRLLWDENALMYLKYETMYFAVGLLRQRFRELMGQKTGR